MITFRISTRFNNKADSHESAFTFLQFIQNLLW